MRVPMHRLALLSVYGCRVARLGEKDTGGMNVDVRQIALELGRLRQYRYIPEFLSSLFSFQQSENTGYDLVHSHYWLSGYAGIELSRKWDIPHVTTFHTLAKTKARAGETESQLRISSESEVMNSADGVVVTTPEEGVHQPRIAVDAEYDLLASDRPLACPHEQARAVSTDVEDLVVVVEGRATRLGQGDAEPGGLSAKVIGLE